jgi:hypothetical protein
MASSVAVDGASRSMTVTLKGLFSGRHGREPLQVRLHADQQRQAFMHERVEVDSEDADRMIELHRRHQHTGESRRKETPSGTAHGALRSGTAPLRFSSAIPAHGATACGLPCAISLH